LRYIEDFVSKFGLPAKDWPQYVKNQIFKQIKFTVDKPQHLRTKPGVSPSLSHYKPIIEELSWEYSKEPETIRVKTDLSNFTPRVRADLMVRMKNIVDVPQDYKRHEYQKNVFQSLLDDKLTNEEPVLLKEAGINVYEIREGWHRTAQLLAEAIKRKLPVVNYKAYIGKKGLGFNKINYHLENFVRYLYNMPEYKSFLDVAEGKKTPYRQLLKEVGEERKQLIPKMSMDILLRSVIKDLRDWGSV